MTNEQKDILHEKFQEMEKYSTWTVLFLFLIITILHIVNPHSEFVQSYVQVTFSICLGLVLLFVLLSLLKDLLFPIIAKFYFKNDH